MTDTPTRADLIERLRSVDVSWSEVGEWCAEAAAALTADAERIAVLEGEMERLRGANQEAAECVSAMMQECARYRDEIRAALKGTDHDPAQIEGQEA